MLISNTLKKHDVISIKLLTGEEIIARFENDESDALIVSKASTLASNPQGGLGIIPWMMSSNPDTLRINKSSIIAHSLTDKELADNYISSITGIQLS